MFLSRFYNDMGFEPSHRKNLENFKADLRKIISDLLFYYRK